MSALWGYYRAGQLGFEPIPEDPPSDRLRWAEAAPKMAMALSEAGYPTRLDAVSAVAPNRVHELVFTGGFPPDDVLMKAAELCGICDVMEKAVILHPPLSEHGDKT